MMQQSTGKCKSGSGAEMQQPTCIIYLTTKIKYAAAASFKRNSEACHIKIYSESKEAGVVSSLSSDHYY
jgi:hypothetical protein